MDPMTMGALSLVGTGLQVVSGIQQAGAQASAMEAQAAAEQEKANVEQQWSNRRALEERASAQRTAGDYERQARLAQSRLGAVAGASGSSGSDATVMNLWSGIKREGDYNAQTAVMAGEQKASGLTYQSALDRWTADTNARIKRASASSTLTGGVLGALGTGFSGLSKMGERYQLRGTTTGRTGYGIG